MRRQDKIRNMEVSNMILEGTQMGITERDVALYLTEGLSEEVLNEREQLNEIVGVVKSLMTSHKVAEFLTQMAKWFLKVTGLGSEKKCGEITCAEGLIEKLQHKLHEIHHWFEDKITYVAAMVKFKTLKPSDEQKEQSKKLAEYIMIGIFTTFLLMYIQAFGLAIASGSIAKAAWPLIGTITKTADLIDIKKKSEQDISSELQH